MDYNKKFKNRVEGYMYAAKKYDKVLENENIIYDLWNNIF